jgi:hypothetical protein
MKIKRQNLSLFSRESATCATDVSWMPSARKKLSLPFTNPLAQTASTFGRQLSFQLLSSLMPMETSGITPAPQIEQYRTYEVINNLVLPDGFTYKVGSC